MTSNKNVHESNHPSPSRKLHPSCQTNPGCLLWRRNILCDEIVALEHWSKSLRTLTVRHCWVGCPAVLCVPSIVLGLVLLTNCTYEIAIWNKKETTNLPGALIVTRLWPFQPFPPTDFFAKIPRLDLEYRNHAMNLIKSRSPDLEYVQVEKSIMRTMNCNGQ